MVVEHREFRSESELTPYLLEGVEFDGCHLINCNLMQVDLSRLTFSGCRFSGCNLAMVKLTQTAFRSVLFQDCKMLGMHFEHGNLFGFSATFDGCQLNHSSFYQMKLKGIKYLKCQLMEADFTESDLTQAVFDQCNLAGALFSYSNLERADFRSSVGYQISPLTNRLRKAKFSIDGVEGLLSAFDVVVER